jgi:hypothetical protein
MRKTQQVSRGSRLATRSQHAAALMGEEEEMSDGELRRKVLVGDKPHAISVYRKSKSVWIAAGDYMGVRSRSRIEARRGPQTLARSGGEKGN